MSVGVDVLTAEKIREQQERFPRVFSMTLEQKLVRWGALLFTLGLLVYMLNQLGFFSERFYGNLGKLAIMFGQMFPPTTGGQFWDFVDAIGDTLGMALIGSVIGSLAAVPLAFMAWHSWRRRTSTRFDRYSLRLDALLTCFEPPTT